jgi:hypothetical protein
MERRLAFRKTRDDRDMNNIVLFSSDYVKIVCDFKSILSSDYNSVRQ